MYNLHTERFIYCCCSLSNLRWDNPHLLRSISLSGLSHLSMLRLILLVNKHEELAESKKISGKYSFQIWFTLSEKQIVSTCPHFSCWSAFPHLTQQQHHFLMGVEMQKKEKERKTHETYLFTCTRSKTRFEIFNL